MSRGMSKRLKKWQIVENRAQLLAERDRERSKYLIQCKINEIERLKNQIKAHKEIDAIKDATIQVLVGRSLVGKHIAMDKIKHALNNPARLIIKKTEDGYKLKVK